MRLGARRKLQVRLTLEVLDDDDAGTETRRINLTFHRPLMADPSPAPLPTEWVRRQ